jgi:hypothetical protein
VASGRYRASVRGKIRRFYRSAKVSALAASGAVVVYLGT